MYRLPRAKIQYIMAMSANPTACVILIGNEILSGRTQDKNLAFLSQSLNDCGVHVTEARVIPDIESVIVETINYYRSRFTYIFTTGGIGPTHDDITTASVARAFGVPVLRHPEAEKRLRAHYADGPSEINDARLKMADIPEGAELINNPVSAAPGFRLENVFVLAGIPSICRAMMDEIRHQLKGGKPIQTVALEADRPEGDLAAGVSDVQNRFPDVEIGIYPLIKNGKLRSNIVLRCNDEKMLDDAYKAMERTLSGLGAKTIATA